MSVSLPPSLRDAVRQQPCARRTVQHEFFVARATLPAYSFARVMNKPAIRLNFSPLPRQVSLCIRRDRLGRIRSLAPTRGPNGRVYHVSQVLSTIYQTLGIESAQTFSNVNGWPMQQRQQLEWTMPLINCPACSREISTEAEACPQCGHPNRASTRVPAGPEVVTWRGSVMAVTKPCSFDTSTGRTELLRLFGSRDDAVPELQRV